MNTVVNINPSPCLFSSHVVPCMAQAQAFKRMESTAQDHCPLSTCVLGTEALLALVYRLSDPTGILKAWCYICHSGETLCTLEVKEIAFLLGTNLEQNSNRFLYCFSILPVWALFASYVVGRAEISCHYSFYKGCRTCASFSQLCLTFFPFMELLALLWKRIFWLGR